MRKFFQRKNKSTGQKKKRLQANKLVFLPVALIIIIIAAIIILCKCTRLEWSWWVIGQLSAVPAGQASPWLSCKQAQLV